MFKITFTVLIIAFSCISSAQTFSSQEVQNVTVQELTLGQTITGSLEDGIHFLRVQCLPEGQQMQVQLRSNKLDLEDKQFAIYPGEGVRVQDTVYFCNN